MLQISSFLQQFDFRKFSTYSASFPFILSLILNKRNNKISVCRFRDFGGLFALLMHSDEVKMATNQAVFKGQGRNWQSLRIWFLSSSHLAVKLSTEESLL